MKCDFCSSAAVRWTYPCNDFLLDLPTGRQWGSEGDWAACGLCSELIEAGAHEALSTRSAFTYASAASGPVRSSADELVGAFTQLHLAFLANRTGERHAWG